MATTPATLGPGGVHALAAAEAEVVRLRGLLGEAVEEMRVAGRSTAIGRLAADRLTSNANRLARAATHGGPHA